jgi:hypothetical protein
MGTAAARCSQSAGRAIVAVSGLDSGLERNREHDETESRWRRGAERGDVQCIRTLARLLAQDLQR